MRGDVGYLFIFGNSAHHQKIKKVAVFLSGGRKTILNITY